MMNGDERAPEAMLREEELSAAVRDALLAAHAALRVEVPHSEEGYSGYVRARARAAIEALNPWRDLPPYRSPAPEARDPRCGSAGVDADGHCVRCGYPVDPQTTELCPPGFLAPEAREALRERLTHAASLPHQWDYPDGEVRISGRLWSQLLIDLAALLSERPDAPAFRGLNEYEARLQSRLLNELATFEPDAPAERRECLCEKCGREYPVWFAPNELWNCYVRLPDGRDRWSFLCPTCFGLLVAAGDPGVILRLEPDAPGGEREP